MKNGLFKRLGERLGPVWGPAALLFVAMRFTDVVNAFVGLFVVPRYVPQADLGAVLPLTQFAAVISMPLAIALSPYVKLLNVHAARGEHGKVKRMVRDASLIAAGVFAVTLAASPFAFRYIFERFEIENGLLAAAIVVSAVLAALTPVFTETLRALQRFSVASVCNAIVGPVRLVAMLVFLPFRGLTGYFAAQGTVSLSQAGVAVADFLRRHAKTRGEPYWREDRATFLAYCVPLAVMAVIGNFRGLQEMMLMSLVPDVESAAYYQLTRFTEIAAYAGSSVAFVVFPVASTMHDRGADTNRILRQTTLFVFAIGFLFSAGFSLVARQVFEAVPFMRDYAAFTGLVLPLGLLASMRAATTCFTAHRLACGSFGYAWYTCTLGVADIALIRLALAPSAGAPLRRLLCGSPDAWNLSGIVALMCAYAFAVFACNLVHMRLLAGRNKSAA